MGICVSRSPLLALTSGPRSSICVCLFFVLKLKFVRVTVSIYINSASSFLYVLNFLSIMWEISKLFGNN